MGERVVSYTLEIRRGHSTYPLLVPSEHVKTPQPLRSAADEEDDLTIARREYDDESVVAVDFGRGSRRRWTSSATR